MTPEIAKLLLELDALGKLYRSERTRLAGLLHEKFEQELPIICADPDAVGIQTGSAPRH